MRSSAVLSDCMSSTFFFYFGTISAVQLVLVLESEEDAAGTHVSLICVSQLSPPHVARVHLTLRTQKKKTKKL